MFQFLSNILLALRCSEMYCL